LAGSVAALRLEGADHAAAERASARVRGTAGECLVALAFEVREAVAIVLAVGLQLHRTFVLLAVGREIDIPARLRQAAGCGLLLLRLGAAIPAIPEAVAPAVITAEAAGAVVVPLGAGRGRRGGDGHRQNGGKQGDGDGDGDFLGGRLDGVEHFNSSFSV